MDKYKEKVAKLISDYGVDVMLFVLMIGTKALQKEKAKQQYTKMVDDVYAKVSKRLKEEENNDESKEETE